MIPLTSYKDKNVALFGLGGSGMVTAEALVAGGAKVTAFDDNPERVIDAGNNGIPTGDLRNFDFSGCDALVLSPGVPLTHPKPHWTVELAQKQNVPVIGDIDLFSVERMVQAPNSTFIAITGTNGKSTTTALISHVLSSAGKNVEMGGNIGKAVLSLAPPRDDTIYVVECSSYQIDLAPNLISTIGILLNLAPDHLDRHGSMADYASIKERLVQASETAVIGVDDPHTQTIYSRLKEAGKPVVAVSVREVVDGGLCLINDVIEDGEGIAFSLSQAETLRGLHNAQNAMMAIATCRLVGLSDAEILNGLNSFPGLAHRMEILGHINGMLVVNDSKATNADAAAMALASFENIYWISGGLAKEGGIESLHPHFARIKHAYLIGDAAPQFAATLGRDVSFNISETLDNAVEQAMLDFGEDDEGVLLFSPACASFDQFANFEHRGDVFRELACKQSGFRKYGDLG